MLNKIIIMGRICKDIELRRTNSGVAVTSFTLAVDRDFKDADGNRETDFIEVVAWRNTAEFAAKYFGKGKMAVVVGSLQNRKWTDKNGNNRVTAEIQCENLYFGESKGESKTFANNYPPADFNEIEEVDDEDTPF